MDDFDAFGKYLDDLVASGRRLRLWLRDDDAVAPSGALDRLLSVMNRNAVPGLLAVIPAQCTPALAERLASEPMARVATHGWAHQNHQPPEMKKAEFGAERPHADSLLDLRRGYGAIEAAFGARALPVFVPPWNRIGPEIADALPKAGFKALSAFGSTSPGPVHRINAHVDLIDWRGTRGGRAAAPLLAAFRDWAETDEPAVGFLTHHLVHDDAAWGFVERFLTLTSGHPGSEWVSPSTLLEEAARAP